MSKEVNKDLLFFSRANGKLMLSGEYVVLRGAKALAVPLKLGQTFSVYNGQNGNTFSWEALLSEGIWNKVTFNDKLAISDESNTAFSKQLQKILRSALKLSELNISDLVGKKVQTKLEFDPQWGLGSSSTLIYNLSQFFNINPYELLQNTFKGSGYDIANAEHKMPLFFLLVNGNPRSVEINFNPSFKEHIYFIYTGKKQSSKESIKGFHLKKIDPADINQISAISTLFAVCNDISEFQELMADHEDIIGKIIDKTPIRKEQFYDFEGSIKSLGAWGGDFIMAVSKQPMEYVKGYFNKKGLNTIFTFNELVKNDPCSNC